MGPPEIVVDKENNLSLVPAFTQFCQQANRAPRLLKWLLERDLSHSSLLEENSGCLIFTTVISEECYIRSCEKFVETYMRCHKCGSTDTKLHGSHKKSLLRLSCPSCRRKRQVDMNNPMGCCATLETIYE